MSEHKARYTYAKIMSIGFLIANEAPLTFETGDGERHVIVLGIDQIRLLQNMAESVLLVAEQPPMIRTKLLCDAARKTGTEDASTADMKPCDS